MIRFIFYIFIFGIYLTIHQVPLHAEEKKNERDEVHLKKESQEIIGLQLIEVKKRPLFTTIDVIGEIAQDSESAVHATSSKNGILKEIKVNLGQDVQQGAPLCVIKTKEGETVEITSPIQGVVMGQYLKVGDAVDEISSIMTIVNLDIMRAGFNVYEKDLANIRMGQKVKIKTLAYPDKEFEGDVVYVSPQVDVKTRAVKIGINIHNQNQLLKFGMFVTGQILVPVSEEVLVVLEEAVQQIDDKTVIFMPDEKEEGVFRLRPISIGRKTAGFIEVLDGLKEGEKVVGEGSFHLKSELLKGEFEEEGE